MSCSVRSISFFGIMSPRSEAMRAPVLSVSIAFIFLAELELRIAFELINLRDIFVQLDHTIKRRNRLGIFAGLEQSPAKRKMPQLVVRIIARHFAELFDAHALFGHEIHSCCLQRS